MIKVNVECSPIQIVNKPHASDLTVKINWLDKHRIQNLMKFHQMSMNDESRNKIPLQMLIEIRLPDLPIHRLDSNVKQEINNTIKVS